MTKKKQSRVRANASAAARAKDSTVEAVEELREHVRTKAAERRAELGDVEVGLIDSGVPEWTVRLHGRIGHVGGAIVFGILVLVGWPLLATVLITGLALLGTNAITAMPSGVLSLLDVPVELATASSDRFLFTWVLPVLFFTIVAAGLTIWLLMLVVRYAGRWTVRFAQGLFYGYGTSVASDWREVRARAAVRSHRRGERKKQRLERKAQVEQSARELSKIDTA